MLVKSVSLIFNVRSPVKKHSIPKPKQVTAIVWAMSGAFIKSKDKRLKSKVFVFFNSIEFINLLNEIYKISYN